MVNRLLSGWLSSSDPDLKLLRVPFDYQPHQEDECVVYCLWMATNYIKNKHDNSKVRDKTNVLSPDEITENITIVDGGWKPDQDELTMLSERTKTLRFELEYWQDEPPKSLQQIVEENISTGYPVIPFINGLQLREGIRDNDGIHAVVAAGFSDTHIAIHDPWGYPEDLVESEKLEDAWDPMFNQVITVNLSSKGKKLMGDKK